MKNIQFRLSISVINKSLVSLFASILFIRCNQSDKSKTAVASDNLSFSKQDSNKLIVNKAITNKEEYILGLIKNIDEVKASDRYIDSLTNHKKGIASLIFKPAKNEKYYFIQTGYDGENRFETYYNFYVDSATYEIKIQDVIEGDIVTLNGWRKREAKRK